MTCVYLILYVTTGTILPLADSLLFHERRFGDGPLIILECESDRQGLVNSPRDKSRQRLGSPSAAALECATAVLRRCSKILLYTAASICQPSTDPITGVYVHV